MFKSFINFIKNLFWSKKKEENWRDGLIPSPIDYNDVPLGAVSTLKVPPPKNCRIPYILTLKNQENRPKCVGYAGSSKKDELERREQNFMDFSGEWIYDEAKKIDGLPNVQGTYFRMALKVLKNKGAKPIEGNEDVEKFRIGGYVKVDDVSFDGLKQAIYEFGAVLIGFRGSNEGWQTAYIRPPKSGENIWGHAILLIGYNENYLIFQNSWGENWGDKGYGYISKEYLPYLIEAWVVLVDLPNNWKDLLPNQDEKPKYFFAKNLSVGITGSEVKTLQDCLKWLGCMEKMQQSTGYFGQITKQSLIIFQQRYGITPQSGYFGPLSRTKMNELLNTTGKL